ncbi:autotransporter assembly complex family protein [Geminicoccaceae bacterium 1502E]|nr:autotransporter assembly complex family protein [Geminicoccaceae bacterium 1502E]
MMRLPARAAALLLAASALATMPGCSWFGDGEQPGGPALPEAEAGPVLPYEVSFSGPVDDELRTALEGSSQAAGGVARPPASELLLRRRAEDDLPALLRALHSLGYYDGTVEYRIEDAEGAAGTNGANLLGGPRAQLVYEVEPGPRYAFGRVRIELEGEGSDFERPTRSALGLREGEPARAQTVLDAEQKLLREARQAGRALAKVGERDAVIDRDQRTMDLTIRMTPGPQLDYGAIVFEGTEDIDERFLRRRVPVRSGERYDPDDLAAARDSLAETGLFTTIRIKTPEAVDEEGRLPVTFEMRQRKHRSLGAGVGYRTDEGPNVNLFWEHRNFLGAGERLRTDLELSAVRQSLGARFRKPDVGARRQNFLADGSIRRENTEAYKTESVAAGIGFERQFDRELLGSLGLAYRFARIEDKADKNKEDDLVGLLSVPAKLDWNFSDDLLNPTRGGRVTADATPFFDTLDPGTRFFRSRLVHTRYVPLMKDPGLVLALRGAVGSLVGVERDEVPADERFYAGGGGSVRGIGYQLAGPLDDKERPLGGRSLIELNAELRFDLTESIGLVTFLDAGSVYESVLPQPADRMRYGTGAGLRYFTPIGPLRVDVGVPLDHDPEVDDPFQLYISIGQAF